MTFKNVSNLFLHLSHYECPKMARSWENWAVLLNTYPFKWIRRFSNYSCPHLLSPHNQNAFATKSSYKEEQFRFGPKSALSVLPNRAYSEWYSVELVVHVLCRKCKGYLSNVSVANHRILEILQKSKTISFSVAAISAGEKDFPLKLIIVS